MCCAYRVHSNISVLSIYVSPDTRRLIVLCDLMIPNHHHIVFKCDTSQILVSRLKPEEHKRGGLSRRVELFSLVAQAISGAGLHVYMLYTYMNLSCVMLQVLSRDRE